MKLLIIDVNYKFNSTGRLVKSLHDNAILQGLNSYVAFGRGKKSEDKNVYKFGFDYETYFHYIMSRLTGFHGYFSLFSTLKLIRIVKKIKPDVIHIHELHGYFVNITQFMKFLSSLKCKIVWTFHSEYMYTGKGHVYEKSENPNWKRKKEYPSSILFDQSFFLTLKYKKYFSLLKNLVITSPSNWLNHRIQNSFLKGYLTLVIPNFINILQINKTIEQQSVYAKFININSKDKLIVSVAPNIMSEAKGGKWILKLARLFENSSYKFLLIGSKFKKPLKLSSNVFLLPRIQNFDELKYFYKTANILVLTSKRETFSMVALESLAFGTPVIGFKSGAPESIFLEPFAEFVNYGDVLSLADLLLKKLSNKTLKDSKEFAKYFDEKIIIPKFFELYS
jgi:putative colanic acid biosynthesis glycosyltransferase